MRRPLTPARADGRYSRVGMPGRPRGQSTLSSLVAQAVFGMVNEVAGAGGRLRVARLRPPGPETNWGLRPPSPDRGAGGGSRGGGPRRGGYGGSRPGRSRAFGARAHPDGSGVFSAAALACHPSAAAGVRGCGRTGPRRLARQPSHRGRLHPAGVGGGRQHPLHRLRGPLAAVRPAGNRGPCRHPGRLHPGQRGPPRAGHHRRLAVRELHRGRRRLRNPRCGGRPHPARPGLPRHGSGHGRPHHSEHPRDLRRHRNPHPARR